MLSEHQEHPVILQELPKLSPARLCLGAIQEADVTGYRACLGHGSHHVASRGPTFHECCHGWQDEENHKPRRCQHFALWLPTAILANTDPVKPTSTWAQPLLKLPENLIGGEAPKAVA